MPTFNEQMVTKIQQALLANPLGKTISVDGESITREDALAYLERFEARVARESGTRPNAAQINLSGF